MGKLVLSKLGRFGTRLLNKNGSSPLFEQLLCGEIFKLLLQILNKSWFLNSKSNLKILIQNLVRIWVWALNRKGISFQMEQLLFWEFFRFPYKNLNSNPHLNCPFCPKLKFQNPERIWGWLQKQSCRSLKSEQFLF